MSDNPRKRKTAGRSSYGTACAVCKMDHKACDGARPCGRCVFLGSQVCIDSFSTKTYCPFCFSISCLIYLIFFFFALLSCNWCLVSPILPFIIFLSLYLGSFSCYSFFMCNRPTVKTWYRRKPVDRRKRRQLRLLVQMDQRRALVNLRQEKMVKSPSYSTNARLASIFFFFILGVRICHIPTFLSRFTNVQPV